MKITASLLSCATALLIASSPASAQDAAAPAPPPPAAPGPELDIPPAADLLAALPDTLIGAKAIKLPGSPLVLYFPKRLGVDPMAGIMATRGAKIQVEGDLAEQTRGSFHESGLRKIVREASFTTPKWPSAQTFYGEYETGAGLKQTWTVIDGQDRFNVIVTYFNRKDADRLRAEISEKIFGGATIGAAREEQK
ncbi:MAG TPA: hypothetical protein VF574_17940 [Allosphingosinicella sp.]